MITNQHIDIKEKQCKQGVALQNYKLCSDVLEEINSLIKEKHQIQAEIAVLRRKDKKSSWYTKRKEWSFSTSSNDSSNLASSEAEMSPLPINSVLSSISDDGSDA